jgi:hypothetical protein
MIALGGEVAGLFTPSDAMAGALSAASKEAGECLLGGLGGPGAWEHWATH